MSAELRRRLSFELNYTDWLTSQLELRVIALEELLAAPWWRRPRARARLRRQLRASVTPYRWAGPDFETQRLEAAGMEWLTQPVTGPAAAHR